MKITFSIRKFNLLTIFTLTNSLNCFFYKNLITLLVSKPEKTGGCSRYSRSFTCLIFDSRSRWRGNWKFLSQRSIPTFPSKARDIEFYVRVHGWRFNKLKKACFRSCLTFLWSKVDSDILFQNQKLILMFSEIWQGGNLKPCQTSTVNVVFGLYVLMSLIFLCLQRQSPWLMLAMFKTFFSC